jgi:hypothetical protein
MYTPTELDAAVATGALKGLLRGGLGGAAASLATGAAITASAPAWLPFVGGSLLISGATVAAWSTGGAIAGTLSGGLWSFVQERQFQQRFAATFKAKDPT